MQARWRDLVDRRLPEAARGRPGWPVRLDHCFARILLDNACGGPWRESVTAPAWANMPPARLATAIDLGEAVLADRADLDLLNRRSLQWRGKRKVPAAPDGLRDGALILRRWRRGDDAPFAALNADPAVMRHFPDLKNRSESLWEARALDRRFEADGFGPWAVGLEGGAAPAEPFLGFVGAMRLMRPMPFAGGERPGALVEVGWRLAQSGWGRGLATRAARLALRDLFARCGVAAVVAFTAAGNAPSRRVMERLGMTRDPAEDFDHPALAADDPLRRHVLYRLTGAAFGAQDGAAAGGRA
ncbi:GNAT family N-acetyltransferase [Methylobacterium planeticum]|uniref:GNAT family N-acetyltransferase n=1 Tax=Methylobacterium planeticum TaxID=2615211 RepID=A0A6N6MSQ7_9HYPH|nr:GNAT family N-acetyltransferase [Methylobacterium planeticum]KAB1073515.1 GNAT family N-acetyltransferase [Methylobacterium planeticum]